MVAYGLRAAMSAMPSATAGAVSRLAGSAKMFSGGNSEAISRTAFSCRELVRMRMFSLGTRPSSRAMVWLRRVVVPNRLSSCFGRAFLESGQKRVPLPPARIRAYWLEDGLFMGTAWYRLGGWEVRKREMSSFCEHLRFSPGNPRLGWGHATRSVRQ